jgi:hypothetical protein
MVLLVQVGFIVIMVAVHVPMAQEKSLCPATGSWTKKVACAGIAMLYLLRQFHSIIAAYASAFEHGREIMKRDGGTAKMLIYGGNLRGSWFDFHCSLCIDLLVSAINLLALLYVETPLDVVLNSVAFEFFGALDNETVGLLLDTPVVGDTVVQESIELWLGGRKQPERLRARFVYLFGPLVLMLASCVYLPYSA